MLLSSWSRIIATKGVRSNIPMVGITLRKGTMSGSVTSRRIRTAGCSPPGTNQERIARRTIAMTSNLFHRLFWPTSIRIKSTGLRIIRELRYSWQSVSLSGRPITEQCPSDSNERGTLLNSDRIIICHSHRKMSPGMPASCFCKIVMQNCQLAKP